MDIALRTRHDALSREFVCQATELRLVKLEPRGRFSRTIEAFCIEPRAPRFDSMLETFLGCCSECVYLAPRAGLEPLSLAGA